MRPEFNASRIVELICKTEEVFENFFRTSQNQQDWHQFSVRYRLRFAAERLKFE